MGLSIAAENVLGHAPATWPMDSTALAPLRVSIDDAMHDSSLRSVALRCGLATGADQRRSSPT